MRFLLHSTVLLISLTTLSAPAHAQVDWSEYDELYQAVVESHRAAADSPDWNDDAIGCDGRFLTWLEAVVVTAEFEALPEDRQLSLLNAQNRVQFLRARLYLQQGECDSAREDIEAIGQRPNVDEELRQALDGVLAEVQQCVPPIQTATLRITCTPTDAEVLIDGQPVGLANDTFEVELGEHQVVLRADGFDDASFLINAQVEGEMIEHGPISLELVQPVVPEPPETGPTETMAETNQVPVGEEEGVGLRDLVPPVGDPGMVSYVLIGAGASLLIAGLVYDLAITAETRDDFEALQSECENGCSDDRYAEAEALQGDIDGAKVVDGVLYGSAIIATTVGVILLVTSGDSGDDSSVVVAPEIGPQRFGGVVSVGF